MKRSVNAPRDTRLRPNYKSLSRFRVGYILGVDDFHEKAPMKKHLIVTDSEIGYMKAFEDCEKGNIRVNDPKVWIECGGHPETDDICQKCNHYTRVMFMTRCSRCHINVCRDCRVMRTKLCKACYKHENKLA